MHALLSGTYPEFPKKGADMPLFDQRTGIKSDNSDFIQVYPCLLYHKELVCDSTQVRIMLRQVVFGRRSHAFLRSGSDGLTGQEPEIGLEGEPVSVSDLFDMTLDSVGQNTALKYSFQSIWKLYLGTIWYPTLALAAVCVELKAELQTPG